MLFGISYGYIAINLALGALIIFMATRNEKG